MTGRRIRELYNVLLLACERNSLPVPPAFKPGHFGHCAQVIHQPDFGWQFIRFFLNQGIFMPGEVIDSKLRQAYGYLSEPNSYGNFMPEVMEFTAPENNYNQLVLRACLICKDIKMGEIATRFGCDKVVIKTYEKLFFNVRDRFEEQLYLSRLVYPETRASELQPDFLIKLPPGQLLLQVAYLRACFENGTLLL